MITIIPFLNKVNNLILNPIIILLFAVSFLYFVYGIVKFLSVDTATSSKNESRQAIIWGIVGMLIMFSVFGIIHFVLISFGVSSLPTNASQFIPSQ